MDLQNSHLPPIGARVTNGTDDRDLGIVVDVRDNANGPLQVKWDNGETTWQGAAGIYLARPNSFLYNCCSGQIAPDWSQFKSLEIGGCVTETEENGDTFTIGGKSNSEAEFWTIYARHHSGEAQAITDCTTRDAAECAASQLRDISRLPMS
ncbi:hypothetical protein [Bradyrhizobium sp. Ai1a-2]|uniref:hypothetical protein n=1 Tax=Bradyrhizobium sp. Ai1a-2 TaxID=196490 RepID=UPI0004020D4D|nr:hypothetical protein [Bradyrhizobium sp. Ai1a-2]